MNQTSQLGITKTFQITHIFPRLSVFENVRISAQSRKTSFNFWKKADSLEEVNKKTRKILEMVKLADSHDRAASTLSHGERKYLEIGIALATDPKLLLLDEPTANLDPNSAAIIEKAIVNKKSEERIIVMATHNLAQARRMADEIVHIYNGEIVEVASPEQFFENPKSEISRKFVSGELEF